MDTLAWLLVAVGGVMVGLGLIAILGRVPGIPRQDGWTPLALGANALVFGLGRGIDLPGEALLQWLAVILVFGTLFLSWRTRSRRASQGNAN